MSEAKKKKIYISLFFSAQESGLTSGSHRALLVLGSIATLLQCVAHIDSVGGIYVSVGDKIPLRRDDRVRSTELL